ncbi:MAG: hypothetical protein GY789_00460 [Hyphomicrobiales bacterium]|nr:hypothetical protein [Hyphomicrobiales bacterium]
MDKKARKILLDAHWKSGWKEDRSMSDEDWAYAKSKGMVFDSVRIAHDPLVNNLVRMRESVSPRDVGDAFLASLTTRRLDLRSALGSYAVAANFPPHTMNSGPRSEMPSGAVRCQICGAYEFPIPKEEDLNVLNFERHKWGGVRHDQPLYAWFDLSEFLKTTQLDPTEEDRNILRKILQTASRMPSNARPTDLATALSPDLKSNQAERRTLVEILSLSGILQPRGHGGYFGEFTPLFDREHATEHRNDWGYPARWWRGSDGINATAVAAYFPEL